MKYTGRMIEKLNSLLIMNNEVEKLYTEALNLVKEDNFSAFFREQAYERNEFGKELKIEIEKLEVAPKELVALSRAFYLKRMNFKNLIKLNAEAELFNEVYTLKVNSINNYNALLMERNLPLSLCKVLIKQRDRIQVKLNALKREEQFVA